MRCRMSDALKKSGNNVILEKKSNNQTGILGTYGDRKHMTLGFPRLHDQSKLS